MILVTLVEPETSEELERWLVYILVYMDLNVIVNKAYTSKNNNLDTQSNESRCRKHNNDLERNKNL